MKTLHTIEIETDLEKLEANFITYTCTNHPEVIVKDPGKCPYCGKDLVKKY